MSASSVSSSVWPLICRLALGVLELADEERTFARLCEVGEALKTEHDAEVVLLGCAGMAQYRRAVEAEIGVPVIDPTQAAATMAIGAVRLAG